MIIDAIEKPIFDRDYPRARKEIKKYLRSSKFSEDSRLWSAIYYRWMGDFSRSLKLLNKYINPKNLDNASLMTLRRYMEAARALTYLGAEATGLAITRRVNS